VIDITISIYDMIKIFQKKVQAMSLFDLSMKILLVFLNVRQKIIIGTNQIYLRHAFDERLQKIIIKFRSINFDIVLLVALVCDYFLEISVHSYVGNFTIIF